MDANEMAEEVVAALIKREWKNNRDLELAMQREIAIRLDMAIAERTEQCAKICDDRIAFVDEKVSQLENPPVWDKQGYHVHTYAEACRFEAATLAQKIRALNQENKS